MARDGPALGHHPQALHLRAHRRDGGGAHDEPAGGTGGRRNWDYRYAWLRDSAFTAFAFQRLGFYDEALSFNDWIEERCRETDPDDPQLQIVYGIDGTSDLTEVEPSHLEAAAFVAAAGNGAHDHGSWTSTAR